MWDIARSTREAYVSTEEGRERESSGTSLSTRTADGSNSVERAAARGESRFPGEERMSDTGGNLAIMRLSRYDGTIKVVTYWSRSRDSNSDRHAEHVISATRSCD